MPIIEYKPLPPPRKGDRLFRDDLPDFCNNARLKPWGDDGQTAYTEGYLRGATALVAHVLAAGGHEKHFLVYPIIFLYQHHLELALKRIIRRAPRLLRRKLTGAERSHLDKHRLDLLWQDLKPMFTEVFKSVGWERPDQADVEGVDDYICQISELAPDGFAWRYAHSKEGNRSLPKDSKPINLRHFAEMMDRLVSYIDGIDTATSAVEEWQDEMEAEYGHNCDD